MKSYLTVAIASVVATIFSIARADVTLSRTDVRAQFAQARESGDILAPGDSGLTFTELYADRQHAAGIRATDPRTPVTRHTESHSIAVIQERQHAP